MYNGRGGGRGGRGGGGRGRGGGGSFARPFKPGPSLPIGTCIHPIDVPIDSTAPVDLQVLLSALGHYVPFRHKDQDVPLSHMRDFYARCTAVLAAAADHNDEPNVFRAWIAIGQAERRSDIAAIAAAQSQLAVAERARSHRSQAAGSRFETWALRSEHFQKSLLAACIGLYEKCDGAPDFTRPISEFVNPSPATAIDILLLRPFFAAACEECADAGVGVLRLDTLIEHGSASPARLPQWRVLTNVHVYDEDKTAAEFDVVVVDDRTGRVVLVVELKTIVPSLVVGRNQRDKFMRRCARYAVAPDANTVAPLDFITEPGSRSVPQEVLERFEETGDSTPQVSHGLGIGAFRDVCKAPVARWILAAQGKGHTLPLPGPATFVLPKALGRALGLSGAPDVCRPQVALERLIEDANARIDDSGSDEGPTPDSGLDSLSGEEVEEAEELQKGEEEEDTGPGPLLQSAVAAKHHAALAAVRHISEDALKEISRECGQQLFFLTKRGIEPPSKFMDETAAVNCANLIIIPWVDGL